MSDILLRVLRRISGAVLVGLFSLVTCRSLGAEECVLDFRTAWKRVLSCSPALSSAYAQIGVREAERLQAVQYPNPLLAVVADNDSDEDCRGVRSWAPNNLTYSLSQPIELGGKRCYRREIAEKMVDLAHWDEESTKLQLFYQVSEAFLNVVGPQESVRIYKQRLKTAQEIHNATVERVSENRLGILAQYKADVLVRTCHAALQKAERALESAKRELAALWGSDCPDFVEVCYPFFTLEAPPALCTLIHQLRAHPSVIKWNDQIAAARTAVELEKAQQIPDIVVTAGVRNTWWRRSFNTSLLVGIAVPIPVFDRNQGNIDKAHHLYCQAQSRQEEVILELKTELIASYQAWQNAYEVAYCLKETVLPQAQLSYDTAQEGYACGKYEFYDVLDAQQTLFGVHEHYVQALLDYHLTEINIKRLTCYQEIYE